MKRFKQWFIMVMLISLVCLIAYASVELGTTQIQFNIRYSATSGLGTMNLSSSRGVNFTSGTGASQVNTAWAATRTLADDVNEVLDVNDGTLKDAFGVGVTLNKIKLLYIKNNATWANLLIGGDANNVGLYSSSSDILKLPPTGELLYIAPDVNGLSVAVDPNLKIAHDGTGSASLTYDIIILGVQQ